MLPFHLLWSRRTNQKSHGFFGREANPKTQPSFPYIEIYIKWKRLLVIRFYRPLIKLKWNTKKIVMDGLHPFNQWLAVKACWAGLSPSKRFPFMRTPEKATRKHHLTIGWSFGEREYSHQAETWWSLGRGTHSTKLWWKVAMVGWTLTPWPFEVGVTLIYSLNLYPSPVIYGRKPCPSWGSLSVYSCNLLLHNIRGAKGFIA